MNTVELKRSDRCLIFVVNGVDSLPYYQDQVDDSLLTILNRFIQASNLKPNIATHAPVSFTPVFNNCGT